MIWYPPYDEDPDPEKEAEEAAVKYLGHSVDISLPP
jgi:hypothetical protein